MPSVKKNQTTFLHGLGTVRKSLKISRPELCELTKTHRNTVASTENLIRGASLDLASKFASALHCRIDDLVNEPSDSRLREIKRAYHLKQAGEPVQGVA